MKEQVITRRNGWRVIVDSCGIPMEFPPAPPRTKLGSLVRECVNRNGAEKARVLRNLSLVTRIHPNGSISVRVTASSRS